MNQVWRIDTPSQTMVLAVTNGALPCCVYWGPALPETDDLDQLLLAGVMDFTGGMLDGVPPLSVSPQLRDTFPGQPGMRLRDLDGNGLLPAFRFERAELVRDADQSDRLTLISSAAQSGISHECVACYSAHHDVIELSCKVSSSAPVLMEWLAAPVLPAPHHSTHSIELSGRWCGEFQLNDIPWRPGARLRESVQGRTSHEHYPGLYLKSAGTTNSCGPAYAWHYAWSGGHRMLTEELPDGRRQVQFGHAEALHNQPGTFFETAPLYVTFSERGLNGAATAFQHHVRDRIVSWPAPQQARPVHYNCWEAVYFDHDLETLKAIAARAAELGAERFVLDDGWFDGRDDDTSSLGDWTVSQRKYPDGLAPLINHVRLCGMSFGLWFEPEMISEDSHLYRQHPEWVLGHEDQLRGRQQLVLDLSRTEVVSYLFNAISALLTDYDISYIKWDHNRVLPCSDAEQTIRFYELLAALRERHPQVEIESCASGGGRADMGVLKHTQRVWLSDSNDAIERWRIQHDAALFLPSAVTGSHVGPRHCHTSGRVLSMAFRAWVAASRHMGFEMDPRELTDEEAATLVDATHWYKANREWLHNGSIYRLDSDDPAVVGELQLAHDQTCFAAFVAQIPVSAQTLPRPIRLTGLDSDRQYRVQLRDPNVGTTEAISRGTPALKVRTLTLSGQFLMNTGLQLPVSFPATMWLIEGKRL